ncbi:MAG: twin-arginine translocation signal domain-containing protein [Marinospirillum sp.]|uniref:twin-arginine translocation signal domain-containing protein n=1 Tax=Marinospirillum sp. TaxID=2183934 RepID=UPI0019FDF19E|nr:twin-arginine translocation signal domain-containing protein [Marinospirillum sp.]MBE0506566.1 twin-arginine translocation signal domain-containing protein [Marinospirillum sp.]
MQNNKTSATNQLERRRFLKGLAGASAAAGLVAVSANTLAAEQSVTELPDEQVQGYHETDHIRAYYASCR